MSDPKRRVFRDEDGEGSLIRPVSLPDVIDGRYRVLARIGAGSMGVVLRGEDLFLHRPVALKIIEPTGDKRADALAFERFAKEAQALAQVRHENVVQVYAFGPLHGSYYLAMELVVGRSLESLLDELVRAGQTLGVERAMIILRGVARGLEAVHARKLVHRDVKPANIIIENATDRPVLIDFGLARRRSKSSPQMSITGGTPSYMAPEQARDPDGTAVSNRSDLYAFACTAFEVFTGRSLFDRGDIYSMLVAHMVEAPRPLSSLRPELAALDAVLLRALEKNPSDRFASVGEMLAAMELAVARIIGARPRRVLVLAADPGLRRSLVRMTTHAFAARGVAVACEAVASPADAMELVGAERFDLLIADEESTEGRLLPLLAQLRDGHADVPIVVVSRDFEVTRGIVTTRHLVPKPVNAHVLAAVLGRVSL